MPKACNFSKVKINVLLYLETRLVDYGGRVDMRRINGEDQAAIDQMVEDGLILFSRICAADCKPDSSHAVSFTDEAWQFAHSFRKMRADRSEVQRNYRTTAEKRA